MTKLLVLIVCAVLIINVHASVLEKLKEALDNQEQMDNLISLRDELEMRNMEPGDGFMNFEDGLAARDQARMEDGFAARDQAQMEDGFEARDQYQMEDGFAARDQDRIEDDFAARHQDQIEDGFAARNQDQMEDGFAAMGQDQIEDGLIARSHDGIMLLFNDTYLYFIVIQCKNICYVGKVMLYNHILIKTYCNSYNICLQISKYFTIIFVRAVLSKFYVLFLITFQIHSLSHNKALKNQICERV